MFFFLNISPSFSLSLANVSDISCDFLTIVSFLKTSYFNKINKKSDNYLSHSMIPRNIIPHIFKPSEISNFSWGNRQTHDSMNNYYEA